MGTLLLAIIIGTLDWAWDHIHAEDADYEIITEEGDEEIEQMLKSYL